MENSFNNRDFERYVKQNADQYRMFPSEKVWKSVHSALHIRRRRYGIGLALLLLTTATVTGVMLFSGNKNGKLASLGTNTVTKKAPESKSETPLVAIVAPEKSPGTRVTVKKYPNNLQDNFLDNDRIETTEVVEIVSRDLPEPVITSPDARESDPVVKTMPARHKFNNELKAEDISMTAVPMIKQPEVIAANNDKKVISLPVNTEKTAEKNDLYPPFTIESVVNSYIHQRGQRKLEWQVYLSPTVSYRSLSENTEFISAARYNSIMSGGGSTNPVYYSTDVNSVVKHKPDLGFQFGVRAAYPLSKWISLTGGLQLGVSKYDIKAYDHAAEMATINLTTRNAYGSNTVSAVSNYRNGSGYKENWLRNFYFSASIPIGLELKLSDGNKSYFGIASTLAPTYVLDNRAYLISTDYKNYAEVPSLTRKFNLNTSFEVFTAHTTGKLQWRIGPQVHYQIMSSFVKNYPIKEHLFDFGLKLGVTLK